MPGCRGQTSCTFGGHMRFRVVWLFCGLMASCMASGCGTGDANAPRTVQVSGSVSLEGKPLVGAEVRFIAEKFSGYGITNSEGKYVLVQGAVPGMNKVFISKIEGGKNLDSAVAADVEQLRTAADSIKQDPSGSKVNPADIPHEILPPQYSDPQSSKLTFPVPEGGTTSADFRL